MSVHWTIENTKSWLSPETFSSLGIIWFSLIKLQAYNIGHVAQLEEHHYTYMALVATLLQLWGRRFKSCRDWTLFWISWLRRYAERLNNINFTILPDSIIPGHQMKAPRMFSFWKCTRSPSFCVDNFTTFWNKSRHAKKCNAYIAKPFVWDEFCHKRLNTVSHLKITACKLLSGHHLVVSHLPIRPHLPQPVQLGKC